MEGPKNGARVTCAMASMSQPCCSQRSPRQRIESHPTNKLLFIYLLIEVRELRREARSPEAREIGQLCRDVCVATQAVIY